MATGDLKNNLRKLQRLLRQVGYKEDVNYDGMSKGLPAAFLPIYHYALTSYSRHIAKRLNDADIHLMGTTDLKFVELMYRVLRDIFHYKPQVPKEKFFSAGFAERKVIMCTDVVTLVQKLHIQQEPRKPTTLSKSILSSSTRSERSKSAPAQSNKNDPKGPYEPAAYSSSTGPGVAHLKPKPAMQNSTQPMGHATRHPVEKQDAERQEKLVSVAPRKPITKSVIAVAPSLPVAKSAVSFAEIPNAQELPVVEVVRMAEPSSQVDEQQVRPIDIIAQTPGRPVLRDGPSLNYIAQRLDNLVNRVMAMDDRLAAVEAELGAENNTPATGVSPDAGQIETILARLTLIEARMKSTDAKLMGACPTGRVVIPGPTAEEWTSVVNVHSSSSAPVNMLVSNNTEAISATPAGVDAYHRTVDTAPTYNHHNGHFIQDERQPTTSEIMGDENTMPSPVVSDLIRQVVRESCSETSEEPTPRISTPIENPAAEDSFSEVFRSLPGDRLEQALRIQNMMKETKDIIAPVL